MSFTSSHLFLHRAGGEAIKAAHLPHSLLHPGLFLLAFILSRCGLETKTGPGFHLIPSPVQNPCCISIGEASPSQSTLLSPPLPRALLDVSHFESDIHRVPRGSPYIHHD